MLGKGLESLIPPPHQGSEGQATPNKDINPSEESTMEYRDEETPTQFSEPESIDIDTANSDGQRGSVPVKEEVYGDSTIKKIAEPIKNENNSNETNKESVHEDWIIFQIEIDKIKPNPHQPRKYFDEESLRELAVSIREFGIIQPLVVSKIERESEKGWSVHYELIAGERRLMASKLVGLPTVPAIIKSEPKEREKLEIAIIENIQRADLNAIELARAIARLQDEFGLTQREVAARLGKSRAAIANTVRLLGLTSEIQEAIAANKLSESHARLLLSIEDSAMQNQIFQDILQENLSVREADERIKRIRINAVKGEGKSVIRNLIDPEIASLREKLEEFLGTKVDLQSRGKSGKITINFYSPEELEAIVIKVTRQNDSQSPSPHLEP